MKRLIARPERRGAAFAATLGALLLAGCASAPRETAPAAAAIPEVSIEMLRRAIPVAAGTTTVALHNPHGELRVRIGQPGEVGIVATTQRFGAAGPAPTFESSRKGDRLTIHVRYPFAPPPVDPATGRADHTRGRADLAVFVPPDVALELSTTDGRVQVRRAQRDVDARSVSGILDVSTRGALRLSTRSGRVVARQEGGAGPGDSRIETVDGPILLAVPVAGAATLLVETGAAISHDPGIAVEMGTTADGLQRASGRWGSGRHALSVRSARGTVHLVPVIPTPTRD
jgi:hypothetical protein